MEAEQEKMDLNECISVALSRQIHTQTVREKKVHHIKQVTVKQERTW